MLPCHFLGRVFLPEKFHYELYRTSSSPDVSKHTKVPSGIIIMMNGNIFKLSLQNITHLFCGIAID